MKNKSINKKIQIIKKTRFIVSDRLEIITIHKSNKNDEIVHKKNIYFEC